MEEAVSIWLEPGDIIVSDSCYGDKRTYVVTDVIGRRPGDCQGYITIRILDPSGRTEMIPVWDTESGSSWRKL